MDFSGAYTVLKRVYGDGAYVSEIITKEKIDDPFSVRLAYGVIERDYELSAIIKALSDKAPKSAVRLLLKMALYCIKHMDSVPAYAVTSEIVSFAKKIGKGANAGFINAVLKRAIDYELPVPTDEVEALALRVSVPLWIVKKLVKRFGTEECEKLLSYRDHRSNVRFNERRITEGEGLAKLKRAGVSVERSPLGGFRVDTARAVRKMFLDGELTYQSPSSIYVASLSARSNPKRVLDLCSAPGGKAVLIAEKTGADVTACDVHAHRVELIKKYAERMKTQGISTKVMDATVENPDFYDGFDLVLVDAPCSGIGVIGAKPEAMLTRKPEDVGTLVGVQKKILDCASKYVRRGGYLVYSTCTLFEEENEGVVESFLASHDGFRIDMPDGCKTGRTILPHVDKADGFFAVRLKRV